MKKKTPPQHKHDVWYTSGFRKQWYFEPLQVEFQANEAGTKKIRLHPKEDNTVDGDQRSVIVIKRMSTCEGVSRYYAHQIIKVEDIDGKKKRKHLAIKLFILVISRNVNFHGVFI